MEKCSREGKQYQPDPDTKCFGAEYPDPYTAGSLNEYIGKIVKFDYEAPMPTIHKQFITAIMKFCRSRNQVCGDASSKALGYMNLMLDDDEQFHHYSASYQLTCRM